MSSTAVTMRARKLVGIALAMTLPALRRSADRKVSPLVRRQKSKDAPALFNSFGLPAGIAFSCPFATAVCAAICYAHNLERAWSTVSRLVMGNWESLQACGTDIDAMQALLTAMIDDFAGDVRKLVKSGRGTWDELAVFRIHWDGDYYSAEYATAWARTIASFPTITFWSYTRSFAFAGILAGASNHNVYLSIDEANVIDAPAVLASFPTLHAAVLGSTWSHAQELYGTLNRARLAPACPELTGRVELVSPMRRGAELNIGDDGRGACIACGLCVYGRKDVLFAIDRTAGA